MRRTLTILLALSLLCVGCAAPDFSGVVAVRARSNLGSGVVIGLDRDGYIVATAAHVVARDLYPLIDQYIGEVVAISLTSDVALVRIEDRGQGYRVRNLAGVRQGEPVTALGWMLTTRSPTQLAYPGCIITTHWPVPANTFAANCGAFPGMSGGPVVDAWGNVVGLVRGCAQVGIMFLDSTVVIAPARDVRRLMEKS